MSELLTLCEFIVDCEHKTAPIQKEGHPSIRTPNIGFGRLLLDEVNRVSDSTFEEWTQRAVPLAGDLILAREAPVGNVAVIPEGLKCCLGQRTVLIRPDRTKVDSYYLCYLLLTPDMRGALLGKSGGATVHHLNMKDIRALSIPPLPALDVQRRCAGVLRAYDDLIENNQRRIKLLEEAARRLYREWFVALRFPGHERVDVVDGVPQGWERVTLEDLATLNYGKALKDSVRKPGNIPVYGSSGIVGTHNSALVDGPAIIVGRKGNVGSVFLSSGPFFAIDTVYYVSPEQTSLYLFLLLQTLNFISSDSAVPGLNRSYAYSLPVLNPASDVLGNFEEIVQPFFQQISVLSQSNVAAKQARNALLPRLMSGALAV